jgi:hypothetical protein
VLKNIQSPIKQDFPSIVSLDMARVNRAGSIKLPGKSNTCCVAGLLDFFEVFFLLFTLEIVFCCN